MADLSNLKISETYGRVLQKDPDTGELQNLVGAIPPSIKFNGTTLQYVDGNQQNNYILTSDAQGNASWAANSGADTNIYWSADTTPSDTVKYVRISGNTTGAKIGGDLEVTGDTHTANLILPPDGSISPNANNTSIYFRNKLPGAGVASQEWMEIGDDKIHLNIDGNPYLSLTPNNIIFNQAADSIEYAWRQESFEKVLASKIKAANHLWYLKTNVALGLNASNQNWPTTDGLQNSTPDGALKVWGDTTIAPGSGQTGNLGVSGNTDVKGYISADTAVYSYNLFTSNITTTATSTDTLSIQSNAVDIKSHGGSIEYLRIQDDKFAFYLDAGEAVAFQAPSHASPQYIFNAAGQNINFKIDGPTDSNSLEIDVSENRIRMYNHAVVGSTAHIPNLESDNYGLSVTGSSLFYPGTGSTNCINAPGPISADTIIVANGGLGVSGDTEVSGTLSADTSSGRTLTLKEDLGVSGITHVNKLSYGLQTSLGDDTGAGEIANFGSGSLTTGKLYYLNTSGAWTEARANASSSNGNSQLLGIALGSSAASDGVLLRGFFDVTTYFTGTFNEGIPVYVDDANAGKITVTQPADNNEFVRVVGYCTSTANVIYFNPDGTYITVNA